MSYVETINHAIGEILDSQMDDATTHTDAGNAYAHLPREGGWSYHNGLDRLKAFMVENDIETSLDDETLEDLVLDNFEMVPGYTICATSRDVFSIDRYAIVEVETQIEFTELEELTGLNITEGRMKAIGELSREHCLTVDKDSLLAYEVTDCTWDAVISAGELEELIIDAEGL